MVVDEALADDLARLWEMKWKYAVSLKHASVHATLLVPARPKYRLGEVIDFVEDHPPHAPC